MKTQIRTIVLCVVSSWIFSLTAQKLYTFQLVHLKQAKKTYQEAKSDPAISTLLHNADRALKDTTVYSVTFKKQIPPDGDKHSYMSLSPYWWSDTTKMNGLPYIRRDGYSNPEVATIPDRKQLEHMTQDVETLGIAFYITSDKKYAAKAEKLLRVWFTDSTTRMNPSMQFAQAVKGRNTGKGSGVLETHEFIDMLDIVDLLYVNKGLDKNLYTSLQQWFSDYIYWLDTSKIGQDEHNAENNHGSWFVAQYARYALFSGNKESAIKILKEVKTRIATQIEPDGRQPMELVRTKSLGYSMFNLKALCTASLIAEKLGLDIWHYQTKDGRSIKKALDYVLPYALNPQTWTEKQIAKVNKNDLTFLLHMAAQHYPEDKHYSDWLKMAQNDYGYFY